MVMVLTLVIVAPPALLLAGGWLLAPRPDGRGRARVVGLMGAAFGLASAGFGLVAVSGPGLVRLPLGGMPLLYADNLAAVMMLLVGFIGVIVTRFAIRYLDGDPTQGRFLRWTTFTVGAVLLLILAGNLVVLTVAWMLTNLGLHRLLMHYHDRPEAVWAARQKLVISRIGNVFLVLAVAVTYLEFGTLAIDELVARAGERMATGAWTGLTHLLAALYVLTAMTQSAQVPWHSWLPDTMETPTPVSALMHAGIINAGGFLVIRLAWLIGLSSPAMQALALGGAVTAWLGAVVMLPQTSIKRALAYSTVAQMGFMMIQCGLGAFSAALLHVVGHSLYKAHAFLNSGSVLETAAGRRLGPKPEPRFSADLLALAGAALAALGCWAAATWLCGPADHASSGAWVLGLVLVLALTHLLWQAFRSANGAVAAAGLVAAAAVSLAYHAVGQHLDRFISESLPPARLTPVVGPFLASGLFAGFLGLLVVQLMLPHWGRGGVLASLYVHVANGFYADVVARRIVERLWSQPQTAPIALLSQRDQEHGEIECRAAA
ncbi:MAG: hypothetical protein NZ700_05545 [Gemmataceae bacterium]|nr:hypothetical protein [Gemmataceae bacterium]MDW8266113.1 proton-conducting transporter membrane subunit [Gemmataceae bacterium]